MENAKKAWEKLDIFYNCAYETLDRQSGNSFPIEGFFFSDSGILFVRNRDEEICFDPLLKIIRDLNRKMLEHEVMLTTSIAFGNFKYQKRIEFSGIGKDPIYGNAYVSAFLDNEKGTPRIQPGQCRILKSTLSNIYYENPNYLSSDLSRFIKERKDDEEHLYYYWMLGKETKTNDNTHYFDVDNEIVKFEKFYNDAYNLKYAGMFKALKLAATQKLERGTVY